MLSKTINHLVIVGVGLIGGSFSLSLKRAGFVRRVTGVGRSRDNLELAKRLGVVDDWTHDVAEAVKDADMVLLAVPMTAYDTVFAAMAGVLPADSVITDAGSTKQSAIEAANRHLPDPGRFVAAHPIAGTEHSGAAAAFAELFEGQHCIITPDAKTDVGALAAVKAMWEITGSRITLMDAAEHDQALASVSHLPHLVSFALVNAVCRLSADDPFRFAAGGFRDFTRIASSSPEMWRDIALCNRPALLERIEALRGELAAVSRAIEAGDGDFLLNEFRQAKEARDAWLNKHGGDL